MLLLKETRKYINIIRVGKLISKICTPSVAFGLIERKDGSLLAAFTEQKVLAYSYGAWRKFLKISYDPVDLAETPEEAIIICGQLEKNVRNRNVSYGTVENVFQAWPSFKNNMRQRQKRVSVQKQLAVLQ